MLNNAKIGKRIQALRLSRGLSLVQFSQNVGKSENYFRKIESGYIPISIPVLQKVCEVYGVNCDDILRDEVLQCELNVLNRLLARAQNELPIELYHTVEDVLCLLHAVT